MTMGDASLPPITTSGMDRIMRFGASTASTTANGERRMGPVRAVTVAVDNPDEVATMRNASRGGNRPLNRLVLSRQMSFDTGYEDKLPPTASITSTQSLDEGDRSQPTSYANSRTDSPELGSFRGQRTSLDSQVSSPNTTFKPSSQQVRNILKKHVLNRLSRPDAPASFDSTLGPPLLKSSPLFRTSNSFDAADGTHISPSEEDNNLQSLSSPSLPRKRAAYHRNLGLSLDSSDPISSSTFHDNSPRICGEKNRPGAHQADRTPLQRQFTYNHRLAHTGNPPPTTSNPISPVSLSTTTIQCHPPLIDPLLPGLEMPLDLTATSALSRRHQLSRQCSLGRRSQAVNSDHIPSLQSSSPVDWESLRKSSQLRPPSMKRVHTIANSSTSSPPTTPPLPSLTPPQVSLVDEGDSLPTLIEPAFITTASYSPLPALCRNPIVKDSVAGTNDRLQFGHTSMKPHIAGISYGRQQSTSLHETQETLAALTLECNSPQYPPSVSSSSSLTSSTTPNSKDFILSSLERAYEELLRLWVNLPTVDWSVDDDCLPPETPQTALLFDPDMLSNFCVCPNGNNHLVHPECPLRIISILEHITNSKICVPNGMISHQSHAIPSEGLPLVFYLNLMRARMVTQSELSVFHTSEHIARFCPATDDESDECSQQRMQALQVEGVVATLPCGGIGVDSDTVWNPGHTSKSARLAVGQVMCLAHNLVRGKVRNGFALVHPPGHHAEPGLAMGFCYFNSVAVAALNLLKSGLAERVLILDWDIHHGNGTQQATAYHPGLMYISLHRHDNGIFFPGTGGIHETAPKTRTQGYVVNIAWGLSGGLPEIVSNGLITQSMTDFQNLKVMFDEEQEAEATSARRECWRQAIVRRLSDQGMANNRSYDSGVQLMSSEDSSHQTTMCTANDDSSSDSSGGGSLDVTCIKKAASISSSGLGDAEYLAAMRILVIPIATEFSPDVVLISAGFDGAKGHGNALGGYNISPGAFAWMTRQCMSLANGRVGLALEGGYVAQATAECVSTCLSALLLPNPPLALQGLTDPDVRLASLDDSLLTAKAWISPEELQRPPHPEAIQTIAEVAAFHAKYGGWQFLKQLNPSNIALPFDIAIEGERIQTNQRRKL